ncbi:WD repeat domain-containing protein [Microdochium trichocladiopsis]|uniref:WD repeat domain-containing protein n=1 Tax=Microdochium trichocladiopsis TaxID=1682393 RepID=A0A9P8YJY8_9PEZI|nr:WD repeat domain-containing protein [Microdochium trichocladiopsis]KAH7040404.1 WD repeat domain-containing protein [Microdochium trichocladiopsis]
MKAVLPGRPEARLQAVAVGSWQGRRTIVYATGNALAILSDPDTIHQTIYDEDERSLEAVAFDERSGKIAAATGTTVRIYQPIDLDEDTLKWALQASFDIDHDGSTTATLSWGNSEELLVGGTCLALYDTNQTPPLRHWQEKLANPVRTAELSYDSAYIASVGYHDRLVKVWRRLNFGSEEVHFEFGYLPHPQRVARIQWRRPLHVDQTIENVLYTFCSDQTLRIWTGADGHGCQKLRLWGKLDLAQAIQHEAGSAEEGHNARWAFIVGQRDIANAVEKAVQERGDGDVALQYLLSIANRDTELCIVFDGRQSMSAWALEGVSAKTAGTNRIDNVAYVKSDDFIFVKSSQEPLHVEILNYCNNGEGTLHILQHRFDGRVLTYDSDLVDLLDPTVRTARIVQHATWSGHSRSVKKIVRNVSGKAVVSRTETGESILWRHSTRARLPRLSRQAVIPETRHIHRICLLRDGRFVVFLHHDSIALWDCRTQQPQLLDECRYNISGKPLCILVLPRENVKDDSVAHIATITSSQRGVVWKVCLPGPAQNGGHAQANGHAKPSVEEFCRFELGGSSDLSYVLPVDPAGSSRVVSGFLDVFARDVAVSYTHSGRVEFWTAKIDSEQKRVEWLSTAAMETGLPNPSLASGSTMKKAALVNKDRSELSIWDIRGARLEYAQQFENLNTIQDLDWTSTPDSQSILAVGFPYRIILLAQLRFDYLNHGPAWASIREINIRDFTPHPIGDSTWLSDGNLVIGAGNQLFIYDRMTSATESVIPATRLSQHGKDKARDTFEMVQRLNGPLPVFHPQFLSQCIMSGKTQIVRRILLALNYTLKYHVEGEIIDDYLDLDLAEFYAGDQVPTSNGRGDAGALVRRMSFDETDEAFTEDTAASICEMLQKVTLPQLSGHEQIQLLDIVECAGVVEKQRRSMDENGARFMLFFRQHALRKGRTNAIQLSWRETSWAYHSTSQDILTDFVSRQYHGKLLWENARESGIFMWLADEASVKAQFEIVARNEYTRSEMKNPVDCSIYYLALKKKVVLQGLWRMATWNKEQAATTKLLSNNFQDPKWQTTALKNAYALMSKRRFEYAAAFFLLADHLQDAVNVCLNQIKDLQLAIAIARVYEGDNGPVLRKLLENEVLAIAAQEGNRWLASWAFWMLGRKDMAVRALITPVYTLIETPVSPDMKSKLFLTDDPALVVLYSQLRQKTLQTLRGASKVTPQTEWEFVVHNARLYDRMGCDLLGLDLVRNWEFFRPTGLPQMPSLGGEPVIDPRKLLRRRSSLVVADLPTSPVVAEMRTGGGGFNAHGGIKPPPSVFEEPDANSLLDSFGF